MGLGVCVCVCVLVGGIPIGRTNGTVHVCDCFIQEDINVIEKVVVFILETFPQLY